MPLFLVTKKELTGKGGLWDDQRVSSHNPICTQSPTKGKHTQKLGDLVTTDAERLSFQLIGGWDNPKPSWVHWWTKPTTTRLKIPKTKFFGIAHSPLEFFALGGSWVLALAPCLGRSDKVPPFCSTKGQTTAGPFA